MELWAKELHTIELSFQHGIIDGSPVLLGWFLNLVAARDTRQPVARTIVSSRGS